MGGGVSRRVQRGLSAMCLWRILSRLLPLHRPAALPARPRLKPPTRPTAAAMTTHSSAPLLGGLGSSPSSASSGSAAAAWESARKKSRQLETQLYKRLQEFAQVQT